MRRASLASCLLAFALGLTVSTAAEDKPQPKSHIAPRARGITIGAPKVFDNRTLNLMLDRLNSQLNSVTLIDQKALSQAIGAIQGSRIQDTSRAFAVQGLPTPSLTSENDTTSGLTPPATSPTTTNTTKQTSSTPSVAPGLPTLPDLISTPSALTNLQYGMSASDLLSEQVDLTYQIFNLQMLLDRALSDRLLSPSLAPRLQAVIGLNVTVDPPRDAENAVAVVEITLHCPKDGKCDGVPSLVALMPQEHTYNSAALNSHSNAFGGSAVAKVVQVGYTQRRRGQTYYLFRDNDTVSLETQQSSTSHEITFGWAFRPVLGRKSVAPGLRQMFAVVSLPNPDPYSSSKCVKSVEYAVDIKAYWRKYDPGSLTSAYDDKNVRPWAKVGHVLSLGTSLTYAPSEVTDIKDFSLSVPLTSSYLNKLSPDIHSVTWRPVGTKQAVIAVKGQNLFHDTQVVIGDKLLTGSQDGLRLVSDQGMDITTDISALSGDAAILGRYGPATALEQELDAAYKKNLRVDMASIGVAALGGFLELTLDPRFDKECLKPADLNDDKLGRPIVLLNGTVVPGPYQFPANASDASCIEVVVSVPEAAMPKLGGVATLKFPFRKNYVASVRIYDPNTAFKLQALTADKDLLLQKMNGAFVPPDHPEVTASNWRIIIGSDDPVTLSSTCPSAKDAKDTNVFCLLTPHDMFARISIGKAYPCAEGDPATTPAPAPAHPAGAATPPPKSCPPKTFLLQQAFGKAPDLSWVGTYALTVSSTTSDAAKPTLTPKQTQTVNQNDAVWRTFTGTGLSALGPVTVSDTKLSTNPSKDGKSVDVFIPQTLTKSAATIGLTFFDKQAGQVGTAEIIVKATASAATNAGANNPAGGKK